MPLAVTVVSPQPNLIVAVSGEHRCSSWPFWVPSQGVRGVPPMARSAVRVTFWGALAMGTTAGVGALFSAV
jgi:hypothetical protein